MVVGNGFFTDTIEDAILEMKQRTNCDVRKMPYPTMRNISYYLSINGDLFGIQKIANRYITRENKRNKSGIGFYLRVQESPRKQIRVPLILAIYNTYVAEEWTETELEFKNGNVYDTSIQNIQPKQNLIPKEWTERMFLLKDVYSTYFNKVCRYANYVSGIDMEDAKDVAQNTFLYLCTDGYKECAHMDERFVGLWCKFAKLKAFDKAKFGHRFVEDAESVGNRGNNGYEVDLIGVLQGKKQRDYLRMYIDGDTPTEIADIHNVGSSSVRCSVSRSLQFLRRYLRKERI